MKKSPNHLNIRDAFNFLTIAIDVNVILFANFVLMSKYNSPQA
jgi:hypothetical protein